MFRWLLRSWPLLVTLLAGAEIHAQVPFTIHAPGVDQSDFEMTTFAEGLNYPVGMELLSDGSVLVAVTRGDFFGSQRGSLIRLADSDQDGVADERTTLVGSVPSGALTDLRIVDDLVFVTGQRTPMQVYRMGDSPTDPFTHLGELGLEYPSGRWLHPHSALAARNSPTDPDVVELYFHLGSDTNFAVTERQAELSGLGIEAVPIHGDSIYQVTLNNAGSELVTTGVTQIATGLRSAAGLEFDLAGNLYLQDNGIDGFIDDNEPESADELNFIAAADLGGTVEDFGFPFNYIQYRTNEFIGGEAIPPRVAFQPIGDPATGAEGEGPNDIALSPVGFPDALSNGIFVTMHGRFPLGGVENEENPLIFVDLEDNSYVHFIRNDEPNIGHIDGLLATSDSLYLADISPSGGFGRTANDTGKIYRIRSLVSELLLADVNGDGTLDAADASQLCGALDAGQLEQALLEIDSARGDFDLNGEVDFADFLTLSVHFGESVEPPNYAQGDANCSGHIDFADFLVVSQNFGQQSLAAVPEPSCVCLSGWVLVMLGCLSRKRRPLHVVDCR